MNNFCPECGSERIENSKYCINCGYKFPVENNQYSNEDNFEPNYDVDYNNNYNENNNNFNYNGDNSHVDDNSICPHCSSQLNTYTKTGFLSGGTYHNCPNCGLEFREDNTNLTLTNAHEGTRARNKYLYKSFTIGEWQNIFSDNLSNSEINEIYEYKNNGFSSIDCPLCHNRLNIYEKDGLFSDSIILMCNTCKTSFKQENNLYKFINTAITNTPLWNYYNQPLTMEEWDRITEGGLSNGEIEQAQREELARIRDSDIQVFMDTLSTDNPMLPQINSVGLLLKKNEHPILELENITLQEPRAVRVSRGGYGGTSIRIAKGITLHTGGTRGRSESHDEIRNIDNGKLLITNKRIMFLGSNRTTNIDINKIVSIEDYLDGIKIQRSNKQKPEYFIGVDNNSITINIEGRQHNVLFNGEMIREIIIGRLN